jgi:hypothetical protein
VNDLTKAEKCLRFGGSSAETDAPVTSSGRLVFVLVIVLKKGSQSKSLCNIVPSFSKTTEINSHLEDANDLQNLL